MLYQKIIFTKVFFSTKRWFKKKKENCKYYLQCFHHIINYYPSTSSKRGDSQRTGCVGNSRQAKSSGWTPLVSVRVTASQDLLPSFTLYFLLLSSATEIEPRNVCTEQAEGGCLLSMQYFLFQTTDTTQLYSEFTKSYNILSLTRVLERNVQSVIYL